MHLFEEEDCMQLKAVSVNLWRFDLVLSVLVLEISPPDVWSSMAQK